MVCLSFAICLKETMMAMLVMRRYHRLQDEVISGGRPQELAQNRTNDLVAKFLGGRYGTDPADWGPLPPNFASVVRAVLFVDNYASAGTQSVGTPSVAAKSHRSLSQPTFSHCATCRTSGSTGIWAPLFPQLTLASLGHRKRDLPRHWD